MIEASSRLAGINDLIDRNQYFVIHAARQSGKTTFLLDLANRLNREKQYYALYCSLEVAQGIIEPEKGIPAIVKRIKLALRHSAIPGAKAFAADADYDDYANILNSELTAFCISLDKPLVILFDEADCLSEGTLISFLRQLRNGYNMRSITPFVHSLALVGMRNIRDFRAHIRPDSETLGSASPFNIVAKALTLSNFTKEEIASLYRQHTDETGQPFEPEAVDTAWRQTQGQPWLVNAIAREAVVEMLHSDYTRPVTAEMIATAIQTIILRRDTHIDSLLERLKEKRVQRIVEPVIIGSEDIDALSDDYLYACDLGLIRRNAAGIIEPSNPIYAEVIVRTLSYNTQVSLQQDENSPYQMPRYLKDGRIDMTFLMRDFQAFWRENSDIWVKRYDYEEAAPHLILQAFLQRVINGGGSIHREMAAGRKRMDLCVEYERRKYPVEMKLLRTTGTQDRGLTQILRYMDTLGCTEGWLMIFDRRPDVGWDDKIYLKTEVVEGKTVTVVGC
jgi:hypothetical protein